MWRSSSAPREKGLFVPLRPEPPSAPWPEALYSRMAVSSDSFKISVAGPAPGGSYVQCSLEMVAPVSPPPFAARGRTSTEDSAAAHLLFLQCRRTNSVSTCSGSDGMLSTQARAIGAPRARSLVDSARSSAGPRAPPAESSSFCLARGRSPARHQQGRRDERDGGARELEGLALWTLRLRSSSCDAFLHPTGGRGQQARDLS